MQSPHYRGSFYISGNIMGLGILTHSRRDWLIWPKTAGTYKVILFLKDIQVGFIKFPNSRITLSVFTLPLLSSAGEVWG